MRDAPSGLVVAFCALLVAGGYFAWARPRPALRLPEAARGPRGAGAMTGARVPLWIKRTSWPKVAIPLQRGANFQFLDFGTPLE
mgnify:CR=1 FL=1